MPETPPVWVPRRMTPSDGQNIAGCGGALIVGFIIVFCVLLIGIGAWDVIAWFAGVVWEALNV